MDAEPAGAAEETAVEVALPRRRLFSRRVLLHAYLGETVLLIGLLAVLNLGFLPSHPGFLGIEPNPFWAVILLMVARYGFRAGLFSATVAAVTYLALLAGRVGQDVFSVRDLMAWSYARPAILFLLVGVVLGLLVQRHKNRIRQLEEEIGRLIRENQTLRRGEEELRDVNVELANRVIGATDTLPLLYRFAKKLNVLDVEVIFTVLTELVVEVAKATQVAVYVVEGNRLRQHSRNGRAEPGGELKLEPGVFEEIVGRRRIITLHDLLSRNIRRPDLLLCGPLSAGPGGEVVAVLCVEELEFLRYNPATIRLFHVVVDWAAASLEKAVEFRARPKEREQEEARRHRQRVQRSTHQIAGVIDGEEPARPPSAAGGIGGILPGATGSTALSQILDQTQERLFGEVSEGIPLEGQVAADPRSLSELQLMMSGELKIAGDAGSPLAKLLAAIDGYVSRGGGEG